MYQLDDPDNRTLELAVTAQTDFIITGNTKDFTFCQYEGINVVTPEPKMGGTFIKF